MNALMLSRYQFKTPHITSHLLVVFDVTQHPPMPLTPDIDKRPLGPCRLPHLATDISDSAVTPPIYPPN